MKILVIVSFLIFNYNAQADGQQDFGKRKTRLLQEFDLKISDMQGHKACIANAKSDDQIKACRTTARNKRKENQAHMKTGMDETRKKEMRERFTKMLEKSKKKK